MSGKHQYHVISNAYDRNHLIEVGKKNGVYWEDSKHEGVNWMRFSHALTKHLDENKPFHHDDTDLETLNNMLNSYTQLRDMHKQTMIPHLRSAMAKLHSDKGDANLRPIDLLQEAHSHLSANGGSHWAEKVSTLHKLNHHIGKLNERIEYLGRLNEG